MAAKAVRLLLGKCVPSVKPNASKICITQLELDEYIHMYFKKVSYVYAHDPDKMCKTGDIVLIEELPQKLSKLVTHKVNKIVFPLGDVTDPITGKKVLAVEYRDDIVEKSKLYGENEKKFDFDKAPPRGWQEGLKDFTDKETYTKYHETGEPQPYGV